MGSPSLPHPSAPTHIVPEIGSLHDILHQHRHLCLYVPPTRWTDLHTRILKTRFLLRPPITTPVPVLTPPSSQSPRSALKPPPVVVSISRSLDYILLPKKSPLHQSFAVESILSTLYPQHLPKAEHRSELGLRFGQKLYPEFVHCNLLWNPAPLGTSFDSATTCVASESADERRSSPASVERWTGEAPVLAYVDRKFIDLTRRHCGRIPPGPNNEPNHPVLRLQALRSKLLKPENIDEDPYLVAVMLAMAQRSVYADMRDERSFAPRDVKVWVLAKDEKQATFIVYTATVPGALLSMFHRPEAAPTGDAGIKVEYHHVNFWPVLGLKERLGKALGADLVGNFEGVALDRYGAAAAPPAPVSGKKKRRRAALAEVFNTSFSSEQRDTDAPASVAEPFAKRRCTPEVRLGVVQ
ncbi:hypothetical protein F5Y17DRAFT_469209 [Xylariaceae sp. FL0594]|nr:hypothetical protein F5Y17DRAFT_469209 [Xylariaceae sp. FL0594]